jgi:hypothetical protein
MIKGTKPTKRGKKTSTRSFKKIKIDEEQINMGHARLEKRQHSKLSKSKAEEELSYTIDGISGQNSDQSSLNGLKRRAPLDPDRFKRKKIQISDDLSDAVRRFSKKMERSKSQKEIKENGVSQSDIWGEKAPETKRKEAKPTEAEIRKDPFILVRKGNQDKMPIGAESYNPSMADYDKGLEMLVKKKAPIDKTKKLEEKKKKKLAKLRNETNLIKKKVVMPKNSKTRQEMEEKAKRKEEKQAKRDTKSIELYNREIENSLAREERKREEKKKQRESINQQIAQGLVPPVRKRGGIEVTTQDPFIADESELQGNLRKMITSNKSSIRDAFNGFSRKGMYEPTDPFSRNSKRPKDSRKEHGRETQEKRTIEDFNLVL